MSNGTKVFGASSALWPVVTVFPIQSARIRRQKKQFQSCRVSVCHRRCCSNPLYDRHMRCLFVVGLEPSSGPSVEKKCRLRELNHGADRNAAERYTLYTKENLALGPLIANPGSFAQEKSPGAFLISAPAGGPQSLVDKVVDPERGYAAAKPPAASRGPAEQDCYSYLNCGIALSWSLLAPLSTA